jgi:glycosyltransferase involved in cell wall biosynthesis
MGAVALRNDSSLFMRPSNGKSDTDASSYSMAKSKLKRLTDDLLRMIGIRITRAASGQYERVVSLRPEYTSRETVLLSWNVHPFLQKPGESISSSHTAYWECVQAARTFLELGYAVDIIDSGNQTFQPTKPYAVFFGHWIDFDRIVRLLKEECIKIAYLDTAHWVFNNQATFRRKLELQQRRGVTIVGSHRLIEHNLAIEHANYAVFYGNQFTLGTYRYANKPLYRVPISTCALFPWPMHKDHNTCRGNFLWLGSRGFVHKGLDLVLEAFAGMPESHLYVCGPFEKEKDFIRVFYKELYQTPNIHAVGWVDVNGPEFIEIANKCVGLVYPSCSEGQAGTVTTSMHAGLIPIVSYESGVDVEDCGVVLKDCSIRTIQETVQQISHSPAGRLQHMARNAWEYARANHTREHFAEAFKKIVVAIMEESRKCKS